MKNIVEICRGLGIEIPEEQQKALLDAVKAEGYITPAEHEKKLRRAEDDRDAWKQKAETAEEALKGFDGIDPAKIQTELESWKQKAADAEKHAQEQIYQRDFEDALKAAMESVKFTSEAARRDVLAQIKAAGLKLKDGTILGLGDLIGQIRKSDASAFVDEEKEKMEQSKARFTAVKTVGGDKSGIMTKEEIMAIKDRGERRAAIAQHMDLFEN